MWAAAVQLNSTPDLNHNLARARALIQEAAAKEAQLIALPEHFAYLGPEDQKPPSAQPLDGPLVSGFRDLAGKLGVFLLLGSFPEIAGPEERPYNTSVLIGPHGDILATYRKMHLFDVDLSKGPSYKESQFIQAGKELAVAPLPGTPFTAGLAICNDIWQGLAPPRDPVVWDGIAAEYIDCGAWVKRNSEEESGGAGERESRRAGEQGNGEAEEHENATPHLST